MLKTGFSSPLQIHFSGWKEVFWKVKEQLGQDHVSIVAAGVAFYAFLAVFPAIAALISIYGLAMDPSQIQNQLVKLSALMPEQAFQILRNQIESLMKTSGSTLGWSLAFGILLSLWSANKGMKTLLTGVHIAYDLDTSRGFIKQNALSLLFTFGAIVLVILSMMFIVGFPALVHQLDLPPMVEDLIGLGRWIVLAMVVIFFLGMIYRFGPYRRISTFKWVLPGALLATLLWLIASWGFSFYVSNFGSYGEMYGSVSAVVVLMLWLFLTSSVILLGAEVNSEIEKYVRNHTESH